MTKQTSRRTTRAYPDLKTWRAAQTLSQQEAADLLDISQASYARFERRVRYVKGDLAKRLMARTGVPVEVLTGVA